MIRIETQKKLLFIPFINLGIVLIAVLVNGKYMEENWAFKAFKYYLVCAILELGLIRLKSIFGDYLRLLRGFDVIFFYIFTIIGCYTFICIQQRFLK